MTSIDKGADWISKLWVKLNSIKEKKEQELEEINRIIFGDPLQIAKYYIEPNCQERNPADRHEEDYLVSREPMMKKIDQFLNESIVLHHGENQMFVLSDAGMGKTALLTMLKLRHLTAFLPQSKDCILKKLGKTTLEDVAAIPNKRKTILLLDSLDEDPLAFGKVRERLLEILEATQDFFRVIITCRTQFFPKMDEDRLERIGKVSVSGYSCPVKYLSFFNDEMVTEYLYKRFPGKLFGLLKPKKKIGAAEEVIRKMGSLRCRPMLLTYIEDLMASPLIKEGNSEYIIYDELIMNWLKREELKTKIPVKNLLDACIILATCMQIIQRRIISDDELNRLIRAIKRINPVKYIELKGRSLLNRNSDGDYRFSHYSIQEFLVAKLLLEKPIWEPGQPIPMTDFIFRMILISETSPKFPELLDGSSLNLREAQLGNIRLPCINLKGVDLSMLNLSGADLSRADLSDTNLSKANLKGANLKGANLSKANLKGANLKGANLSKANLKGANLEGLLFEWEYRLKNTLRMEFVYISPGEFIMGSPENEPGRFENETQHKVTLTRGFYMMTTPVTQTQWKAAMGNNPSGFKGDKHPVEKVSWDDVQEFIKKLNETEGANLYRLPTEAEWEYACRAGSEATYSFGNDAKNLKDYAWYNDNSDKKTHPVAQLKPNRWGIYDMHGHVWEWCQDWYGDYLTGSVIDPKGNNTGSSQVLRGGSFFFDARGCRSAYRNGAHPDYRGNYLGFRLLREAP